MQHSECDPEAFKDISHINKKVLPESVIKVLCEIFSTVKSLGKISIRMTFLLIKMTAENNKFYIMHYVFNVNVLTLIALYFVDLYIMQIN